MDSQTQKGITMNTRNENMSDEVVKTNRLNTVIQNLSLAELRLIQLGIVDARENQEGLTANKPLFISAKRYADCFDVESHTAYEVLKSVEKTLFDRRFTFVNERHNEVKSRWISQVEYHKGEGGISIILTPAVVDEITRIDGYETAFTSYLLKQTARLNSVYSVRLYELSKQWLTAKKAKFELELLRGQLGLGVNEYVRMSDFKKRVLDLAVNEINDKTDLKVSYTNIKKGRKIVGFNFKILEKPKPKKDKKEKEDIKKDNGDLFTIGNLSDKQLARIANNPQFKADFNHMISATSPINNDYSGKMWANHFVKELKKDATQFTKKHPLNYYLDY